MINIKKIGNWIQVGDKYININHISLITPKENHCRVQGHNIDICLGCKPSELMDYIKRCETNVISG